jgi:hypothetical protein
VRRHSLALDLSTDGDWINVGFVRAHQTSVALAHGQKRPHLTMVDRREVQEEVRIEVAIEIVEGASL